MSARTSAQEPRQKPGRSRVVWIGRCAGDSSSSVSGTVPPAIDGMPVEAEQFLHADGQHRPFAVVADRHMAARRRVEMGRRQRADLALQVMRHQRHQPGVERRRDRCARRTLRRTGTAAASRRAMRSAPRPTYRAMARQARDAASASRWRSVSASLLHGSSDSPCSRSASRMARSASAPDGAGSMRSDKHDGAEPHGLAHPDRALFRGRSALSVRRFDVLRRAPRGSRLRRSPPPRRCARSAPCPADRRRRGRLRRRADRRRRAWRRCHWRARSGRARRAPWRRGPARRGAGARRRVRGVVAAWRPSRLPAWPAARQAGARQSRAATSRRETATAGVRDRRRRRQGRARSTARQACAASRACARPRRLGDHVRQPHRQRQLAHRLAGRRQAAGFVDGVERA